MGRVLVDCQPQTAYHLPSLASKQTKKKYITPLLFECNQTQNIDPFPKPTLTIKDNIDWTQNTLRETKIDIQQMVHSFLLGKKF